ncbi:hypothetical protein [Rhodococcus sp. NPDC006774]|uniref:hypothetical protein n=1 Tax=Rhodococcus sp. NPDC006774 TaxID=3157186 RepID=UPI0033E88145
METDGASASLDVDGIRVTATARSETAPPGTSLTIAPTSDPIEGSDSQVILDETDAVAIELDGGAQPTSPIELTFDLSDRPELAELISDTVRPLVRSSTAGEPSSSDYASADWDPVTRIVSASTSHLTDFQLVIADAGKAFDQLIADMTMSSGPTGSSCSTELTIDGADYSLASTTPDAPVQGCLTDVDGVGIEFANFSDQYYGVSSAPNGTYSNTGPVGSNELLATWLHSRSGDGLLLPQTGGRVVFPQGTAEATVNVDVDPVALQLGTILTGVGMLGVDGDALLTAFETSTTAWQCFTSTAEVMRTYGKIDARQFRDVLADVAQCGLAAGQLANGSARNRALHRMSVAVSLFTDLPDALIANAAGAWNEVIGNNHLIFSLKSTTPDARDSVPVAPSSNLVPLIIKGHGSPADSGTEIAPNHFAVGSILKDDGALYASLNLHWETDNGKGVGQYCVEKSQVLDASGSVVLTREQKLGGCDNGGGWGFNVGPGSYTYVLDVDVRDGESLHAEQSFLVE